MNRKKIIQLIIGIVLIAAGIVGTCMTREAATTKVEVLVEVESTEANASAEQEPQYEVKLQDPPAKKTIPFALSLILVVAGILVSLTAVIPERKPLDTKTLALAAMFAALCYVGFTYCKIDIPVGTEKTAFHLGNVFCVLAALLIGGLWGGMAGSIGMTLADLTTSYVTSAPKTFVLKLGIGLITGLVAHKVFKISQEKQRKVPVAVATVLSSIAGMAFNVVADPISGYFYKTYILGVPQDAAKVWAKIGSVTTTVNAIVAVIAATVLYLALRPALKRARLLPKV